MPSSPDFDPRVFEWPYVLLPLSSGVFGLGYVLYLFESAPALVGLFPRSEVRFVLSQLSIALFAAYLVVVFVTRTVTESSDTASDSGADSRESHQPAGNSSADGDSADAPTTRSAADSAATPVEPQTAAMNQFTQALDEHLAMLCAWYVAANDDPPEEPPASYRALFADDFAATVRRLDFSTAYDAGGSKPTTWLSWSAVRLGEFRRETMAIIDIHSAALDPSVVEQLHTLGNSRLTKRVITADEADLPTEPALLLFPDDTDDPPSAHLDTLRDVLAIHETQGSSAVTPIHEQDCWTADRYPREGVARAAADSDDEQYYKLF